MQLISYMPAIILCNDGKLRDIVVTGRSDLLLEDNYTTKQLVLQSFHCHCEVNDTTQSTDLSTSQKKLFCHRYTGSLTIPTNYKSTIVGLKTS